MNQEDTFDYGYDDFGNEMKFFFFRVSCVVLSFSRPTIISKFVYDVFFS